MTNLQEVSNQEVPELEVVEEAHTEKVMTVVDYLDEAVLAAEKDNMQMSELIGLFFYYAHNLSQQARNTAEAIAEEEEEQAD